MILGIQGYPDYRYNIETGDVISHKRKNARKLKWYVNDEKQAEGRVTLLENNKRGQFYRHQIEDLVCAP